MDGIFVTFEGIDYCGKSLQLELLSQKIVNHGRLVSVIREPGGTVISEKIRDVLLKNEHNQMNSVTEILLYSAARSQVVSEKIVPHLNDGKIVLCDRFFDSTTAYQGYGRGIDLKFVENINRVATQNISPDITYLLDISVDVYHERQNKINAEPDRMEAEGNVFFEKVRQGFLTIARQNTDRFVIIDGSKSIPEIEDIIWQHFWSYLQGGEYAEK